jgi:hypothetical protein
MSETASPTKTITKTIVRRRPKVPGRDSLGGIPTRYLQTGMIFLSLILSGVVAYKVFWPKKDKKSAEQQPMPQYQPQQQLPEELEQQAPILQHPFIPAFENGNGIGNGHGHVHGHPIPNQPAVSSWAEKMILDEQLKRVPVYHDTGINSNTIHMPNQASQHQSRNRENIPVFQYKIPQAPQIGQQQLPQHGSDIF